MIGSDNGVPEGSAALRVRFAGLLFGAVTLATMLLAPPPSGLSDAGWRTAAVGVLMAIWWITEAIPIPATALLPLLLFPLLGVASMDGAASPYANPLIFLFLGGFLLALAMQRWGLHRRVALSVIQTVGTSPRAIVAGFLVSTALLSMWVSNTATAMMMLPIGLSVVQLARGPDSDGPMDVEARNFAIALLLSIAYGASIGGMATLIGTPTNALLAGFMNETYGVKVGFAQWLVIGLPVMILGLPVTHLVLTRLVYPVRMKELAGGSALIRDELRALGRLTRPERLVGIVFLLVATLWITQPLYASLVPGVSDAGIAMLGALLLFVIPVDLREGIFVLDWETAETLPWGVLLLFGGGLSLASAVAKTGLAGWIGGELRGAGDLPTWLVVALVTAVVLLLTELTSNTATAAAFLPVMAAIAAGINENPLLFAVPTVLAASGAFMLPVATPPNAIVYGSRLITIPQMARAGAVLNLAFLFIIVILTYTLLPLAFDVHLGQVPAWTVGR
jgi:sodium-dependent dicarboxylate transporter 2/3/5